MVLGGVLGEETTLGGALLTGGASGTLLLAIIYPVMALVYLLGGRISLGVQAAAATLLLWGGFTLAMLMA
jgi:hypothetical protein